MATAAVTKPQLKQITIDRQTMTLKETKINNHDMIEFNVDGFDGHKYCKLTICAIEYTDSETETQTMHVKSTKGGGVTPLGTIKIGS